MKKTFILICTSLLVGCASEVGSLTHQDTNDQNSQGSNEDELERFLDSIGNLSSNLKDYDFSFNEDSALTNQKQINRLSNQEDFAILKQLISSTKENEGFIEPKLANRFFGTIDFDQSILEDGKIPFTFISFDKKRDDFNEFAICLGNPTMSNRCDVFFCKANRVLTKHALYVKFGLEIEHFRNSEGKTVIYYKENFISGTGVWQNNYFFYQYNGNQLIPVLNYLEKSNLSGWGPRNIWLQSEIIKTSPLTIKVTSYHELTNKNNAEKVCKIGYESTNVQFKWDAPSGTYKPIRKANQMSDLQLLTYDLDANEQLFVHAYYKELKKGLKDKNKRQIILDYLQTVSKAK